MAKPGTGSFPVIPVFVALHIPLGLVLLTSPQLAMVHALVTVLLGIVWALSAKKITQVAYVGAYIAGAEVLWRMVNAPIFWESGKYFSVAIFALAIFRDRNAKLPFLPLFAFLLLVPSAFITLLSNDWQTVRGQLSFYMSGPLALLFACWFFSTISISPRQLLTLLMALLTPIISIAIVTLYTLVTTTRVYWAADSNLIASGGFGPNQVSSVLGLGVLVAILIILHFDIVLPGRLGIVIISLWLAVQTLLTFSRGGVLNAILPALFLGSRNLLRRDQRYRTLLIVVIGSLAFYYVIWPQLDQLTSGMFSYRFSDTTTTGRDLLLEAELQVFAENLAWGVGPGNGSVSRGSSLGEEQVASHTEYSRILAEHGILGAASAFMMVFLAWANLRRTSTPLSRDLVIVMGVWSAVYFTHSGFRLVTPALALGLTLLTLTSVETQPIEGEIQQASDRE